MDDSELRADFREQLGRVKYKTFSKLKPKSVNGHFLNGKMLIDLAQSYIDALNEGAVPNIESAWTNMCAYE